MQFYRSIQHFPKEMKVLLGTFLVVLSIGFLSALQFVSVTTEASPKGIQENYLGNEEDLEAEEMKFKKNEKQLLNIIHSHILSMGLIFFILALLIMTTPTKGFLRKFLLVEPLLSVLITFGGIYFLWKGVLWMKYVVMISGGLMTIAFILSVIVIFYWLVRKSS
ncbi:hypothetical protein D7Z94_14025 [Ulvibacterium marinum]|uniref:Uncharacterized protein n=2 Tax=Ulvibacterium marinum TaxID=2419782 RepID=A0A3B0C9N1_9FLAO|nr:hypothetical protein D7Z94_14025 [Ulvibacterium marinum]